MALIQIIILTILIEFITIFGRFSLKISSKEVLQKVMLKKGWKRIIHFHHGFTGVILVIISIYFQIALLLIFGMSLFLSDMVHHFVILYFIVGSPEFHIVYKNKNALIKEEKNEEKKIKKFFKKITKAFKN